MNKGSADSSSPISPAPTPMGWCPTLPVPCKPPQTASQLAQTTSKLPQMTSKLGLKLKAVRSFISGSSGPTAASQQQQQQQPAHSHDKSHLSSITPNCPISANSASQGLSDKRHFRLATPGCPVSADTASEELSDKVPALQSLVEPQLFVALQENMPSPTAVTPAAVVNASPKCPELPPRAFCPAQQDGKAA